MEAKSRNDLLLKFLEINIDVLFLRWMISRSGKFY